jgi:hypothetical protein
MLRLPLRRLLLAAGAGSVLTCGAMLVLPNGASAAGPVTAAESVLQQAWFWETAYQQANPPVAPPATPPTEPSGVPDGDLAVASTNSDGSSSKLTVLSFDVSSIPHGSTISAFTFTLTLDGQPGATSFAQQAASVVACQPTRGWPAVMPGNMDDAPSVDCAAKVKPIVSGSTYTFKVPAIAQSWIDDQNLGVAIVADPTPNNPPFQLVFSGAKTVKASVTYTPGTTSTGGAVSPPAGTPSGGTAAPGSGAGSSVPDVTGPVPAAPDTASGPASAPPPVVAPSRSLAAPASRPVASVKTAPAAPTAAFWIVGLVLGLALLLASLALGQPVAAAAVAPVSRLDRVLRARTADVLTAPRP